MRRVDYTQGTDEWRAWRDARLGASDAATILGLSPYSTPFDLWAQKVGLKAPTRINGAMLRGMELEDTARKEFESWHGDIFIPATYECTEPGYEFMAASLDGISQEGEILEIKCNGKKWHAMVQEGLVPPHHVPQLQHQMFVCEATVAYYWSFNGKEGICIEVERFDELIDRLKIAEQKFWHQIQTMQWEE